ncbi:class I SAM-dependent methyltransferase [Pseudonocardia sp. CA-107938]|uniref:class I SAM-dependent methyltransferase n=1 Tax=Pseudonocardia sp. CA-107938 TaxID=3240021 RepID=UPI003D8C0204
MSFGARLLDLLTGHALTMMISLGHRTGLFDAAAQGPATSAELAGRAGLAERYVREWLGAVVTGGIMEYDPASGRYTLPAEHAEFLTGERARNVGPTALMLGSLDAVLPEVAAGFRSGDGVEYAQYVTATEGRMGGSWRHIYDEHLVDGFVGGVPGLTERLRAGARALDLGCGTGHAITVLASAFPAAEFVGLDIAPEAIAAAEAERAELALSNARFAVGDAADPLPGGPFDVVFAFDAIHDQQRPDVVLGRVRDALAPDGVFVMVDAKFASAVEDNLDNTYAPMAYAISTLFCVPSTLARGEEALGAVWGVETATRMLAEAGFCQVTVLDSPRPQNCVYVCRTAEVDHCEG